MPSRIYRLLSFFVFLLYFSSTGFARSLPDFVDLVDAYGE